MRRLTWWIPLLLGACATAETPALEEEILALREENAMLRRELATLASDMTQSDVAEPAVDAPVPRHPAAAPESVNDAVTSVQVARAVALRRTTSEQDNTTTVSTDFARFDGGGLLRVKAWLRLELTHPQDAPQVADVTMRFVAKRTRGRYAVREKVSFQIDGSTWECDVVDYEAKRIPVRQGRKQGFLKDETFSVRIPIELAQRIARGTSVSFEDLTLSDEQLGFFAAMVEYASKLKK